MADSNSCTFVMRLRKEEKVVALPRVNFKFVEKKRPLMQLRLKTKLSFAPIMRLKLTSKTVRKLLFNEKKLS